MGLCMRLLSHGRHRTRHASPSPPKATALRLLASQRWRIRHVASTAARLVRGREQRARRAQRCGLRVRERGRELRRQLARGAQHRAALPRREQHAAGGAVAPRAAAPQAAHARRRARQLHAAHLAGEPARAGSRPVRGGVLVGGRWLGGRRGSGRCRVAGRARPPCRRLRPSWAGSCALRTMTTSPCARQFSCAKQFFRPGQKGTLGRRGR